MATLYATNVAKKEELFTEGVNLPSGENIELDSLVCPNCGAEMN